MSPRPLDFLHYRRTRIVLPAGRNHDCGAGKTTTVKLLLGLTRPAQGTVRLFGGDPTRAAARRRTGVMLQVAKVPETLRVREHVHLFSSYYASPMPLDDALAAAGLMAVANRNLRRALEVGASGYLLKDAPSAQLAEAIRRVVTGGRAIDPALAAEAWTEPDPLTERERQVLRLAGEGLSGDAIARELDLSEGTVRNYLSEAIGKLGAKNRIEAARLARQKGWL